MHVVIPYAGDCPYRERALRWVLERYQEHHPSWTISVAGYGTPGVKASAVMPAVKQAPPGLVLVADADCWTDGLARAAEMVTDGAPWAIPHGMVHRLTEEGTEQLLAGASWEGQPLDRPAYQGLEGGGFVVAPRETLLSVPLDPEYVGWGQEDASWGLALHALAGPSWRGPSPLIHLWHPPQPKAMAKYGSIASRERFRRYTAARRSPHKMRELIEEYE